MIAIVLAAGYGTRLYPIIGDFPKALIEVAGETLLGRLCNELETLQPLKAIVIVSNDLYYSQLVRWVKGRSTAGIKILVINNGTRSPKRRLGAVGDLAFAIRECSILGPILVAASDCYFTFPLKEMHDCFVARGGNWIAVSREEEPSVLVDGAVVEIDSESKVTYMQEKPTDPRSNLGALPFYIYESATLPLIEEFLGGGGNADSPGRFPEWMYTRHKLSAYIVDDCYKCEDFGMPDSYAKGGGSVSR